MKLDVPPERPLRLRRVGRKRKGEEEKNGKLPSGGCFERTFCHL